MKNKYFSQLLCLFFTLIIVLMTGACAPTLYKKPVANFQAATKGAQDVYFAQLKNGHESFLFRHQVTLKLDMLAADEYDYKDENYIIQNKKIIELNNEKNIPEESLKIRKGAFKILEYYGKTLHTLASEEKTNALKTELSGFTKDIDNLIKATETLATANDAFDFLKPISNWTGPIGAAIDVLNGIIDIVSDYLREKAIKQAIIKADPMVVQLLSLLQEEAMSAADFQKDNLLQTKRGCDLTKKVGNFPGTANQYIVYDVCSAIEVKLNQLPKSSELEEVFKTVIGSHAEMKKLAKGGDFDTMVERIRHFQQRIEYLQTKFEILMND